MVTEPSLQPTLLLCSGAIAIPHLLILNARFQPPGPLRETWTVHPGGDPELGAWVPTGGPYTPAELDSAFPDVWSDFWNEEVNYSLCLWSSSLVRYLTTGSSCSGGLGKAQPSPLGLESSLAQSALPGHGVSPPSIYFQSILTS